MILGVDLSSNQPTFDFALARSQGCQTGYIKLGGDNIPRYVSGSYAARVDAAKTVGWPVGSYWITGGHDPAVAADFATAHLEAFGPADYIVLDDETLDSGNSYTDHEAATWVLEAHKNVGGNRARILHYGSKSFMESHEWPELLATGCSFLIADYNGTPLQNHVPATIPAARVVGHQYTDHGNIGGAVVDLNAFTDGFLSTISTAAVGVATKIVEEDYSMTQGAFFRLGDGQPALGGIAAGAILHQENLGDPLLPITYEEWLGWAANKNAYANLTTQQLQALVNLVGLFSLDPKTHRRTPAAPGGAAFNGYAIYLP